MPFKLFTGTFHPEFGRPDGDSLRFVPDNPEPLFSLPRRGRAPRINQTNHSIQLRYEGIDTLEKAAIDPFASDATNSNLDLAGTEGGSRPAKGYILTNQIGPHGRPIAFVFSGEPPQEDGSEIYATADDISVSINVQQIKLGHAYPLYYDTLFSELRDYVRELVKKARSEELGVWSSDQTVTGFAWNANVKLLPPIFPKLWRRIDSYTDSETFYEPAERAANLKAYLESLDDERVLLINESRFTGFDNLIEVNGDTIQMTVDPNDIVIVSR